jgi:hypothetical protein
MNVALEESLNYIIITDESLEDSLIFFKNWKELIGFSVSIINTSWIQTTYEGRDKPEQIKNYLTDVEEQENISYVLLVGDDPLVPWRYCFQPQQSDYAIPTDLYYADTSSNWDYDGDSIFAEFDEEWPDFTAEFSIGRIPSNDPKEIQNICQNIITFEKTDEPWKTHALLLAGISNFQNEDGNGDLLGDHAYLMEEMRTNIFNPNQFVTTTAYENQGLRPSPLTSDFPLTQENTADLIEQKYGILTWASHGNSFGSYRRWWTTDSNQDYIPNSNEIRSEYYLLSSDIATQPHNISSIIFSCSCLNADPTDEDNLGKTLLKEGAVCFIGATKESIYFPGWLTEEDGGNMGITYQFFHNIIISKQSCGDSLFNALAYSWNHDTTPVFRNILVFNLYGDPSLSLVSYPSLPIPSPPVLPAGETPILPNTLTSYTTTVTFSHQPIYYLWDWGDGTQTLSGPHQPDQLTSVQHSWSIAGDYLIRVKTVNSIGEESQWSESLPIHVIGPILSVESISGTLLKINAALTNVGEETAENINWSISIEGGFLLRGKESTGLIGTLTPGEKTILISDLIIGFGRNVFITVQAEIPNGSQSVLQQNAMIFFPFIQLKGEVQ